ncbi:signal-regulatory protein beta-2-like [Echeneis naucrates]|uniref:signal-regulatory protein beta-2-like n=1 Tax=Echeneis naucrates TaxID=173247 RepID=UPI0011141FDB|nr:signal-regulatory protein beta-2-like [Echeneis naucrates]XP_029369099.1 signal-regulatory protein beta-2-like [Echeneis naucrates]
MFSSGGTDDLIFETKTAGVGEDVQLTCPRHISDYNANFFWIRLVSGNMPELLGRTYLFHNDGTKKTPRITAKEEPETFPLKISKADQSDTGLYYCVKVVQLDLEVIKGTFLKIKGAEPEITTNFQLPPSDPVRPGDSVTLQCSVLFDSEKKTCPGDHSVYWFRAGSDEAHPSFIYAHGNNRDHCKKSPESESTQKCDYFFSKNVSSSDAGTHYCAVATCGEILFGNGTKLEIDKLEIEGNMMDLQRTNTLLLVLCGTLATALIVTVFLFYMKKKTCDCSKAADAATVSTDQRSQQGDEDRLTYSAPTFTRRKAGKVERRNEKAAEKETVYSGVRAL